MLNKKITFLFSIMLSPTTWATFDMTGGTVTGGNITGSINAKGTAFNDVVFLNSANNKISLDQCTLNGCRIQNADGTSERVSPAQAAELKQNPKPEAPSTNIPPSISAAPSTGAAPSQPGATGNAPDTKPSHAQSSPMNRSDYGPYSNVSGGDSFDQNGEFEGSIFESANKHRLGSESFKSRNRENNLAMRQYLRDNNPEVTREQINPDTLRSRSELAQGFAPSTAGESTWLDPIMGMMKVKDGVIYDGWNNRMGQLMYDAEYKNRHGSSGPTYLHYDEGYRLNGTTIVPKGYYREMSSGIVYDPSGKRWGEAYNDGTVFGAPSFKFERDAKVALHNELP